MKKRNYNISELAANWWADKMRETASKENFSIDKVDKKLDDFEKLLSSRINYRLKMNGTITLSTYCRSSRLLEDTALNSSVCFSLIPYGFEMKISPDLMTVYDKSGNLISYS